MIMRTVIFGLCLFLYCALGWSKGLTVEVSDSQIEMGEQLRLTLTYDPKETHDTPDLSGLQKEFTIIATEQAMSYTVVNGQARSIAQLGVILEPKHSGMLVIPAFQVGSLSSLPQQIKVNPVSSSSPTPSQNNKHASFPDDTVLSVSVDHTHPYLNQEVLYKVSLITRDQLVDVRYQAPQVENAILFPIGENNQSQTIRNGETYQVNEQIYAIFPQKSGPLSITPPTLRALIYSAQPHRVHLRGETLVLEVNPIPKSISRRTWLPSKLVRLRETYDQSTTQFTEGATLVRTIELQAQGLVAQLLPELTFPESQDVRIYPEQPEHDNRIQQGELWGRAKVKITYVFARPGIVELPAIRVPWFNVKTQRQEMAELPSKTYDIRPMTALKKSKKQKFHPKFLAKAEPHLQNRSKNEWKMNPRVILWSLAAFTLMGIILLGGWLWRIRTRNPRRTLKSACLANDTERTKMTLVAWGKQQWPGKTIHHFIDILPLVDKHTELYTALQDLVAVIYHPTRNTDWQGAALWHAIRQYKKRQPREKLKPKKRSAVPPIYPARK